eukprot:1586062-Prymnesium_polylepis.1
MSAVRRTLPMRASDIIEHLSRGIPDIEAGGTADSVDLTASASVHLEQDTWKRNMLFVGITLVLAVHTWDTSLTAPLPPPLKGLLAGVTEPIPYLREHVQACT